MNEGKIYVSFHVGRGGNFNNPGHLSFHGEEDFQQLIQRCSDVCIIISEDANGQPLPDDDWQLVDTGSNVILQGRDEIEAMTGRLEWDTIYDTDYVTTADDLSQSEVDLIWKAYCNEEYMSDDLKDAICTRMGKYRARSIKQYPGSLVVEIQDGSMTIDVDQQYGLFTRDEWKEDLEDRDFCPLSVEEILDRMDYYDATTETGFFSKE